MGVGVYLQTKGGGGGARRSRHREMWIETLENESRVAAQDRAYISRTRGDLAARVCERKGDRNRPVEVCAGLTGRR
jgi:hypothetical protein